MVESTWSSLDSPHDLEGLSVRLGSRYIDWNDARVGSINFWVGLTGVKQIAEGAGRGKGFIPPFWRTKKGAAANV